MLCVIYNVDTHHRRVFSFGDPSICVTSGSVLLGNVSGERAGNSGRTCACVVVVKSRKVRQVMDIRHRHHGYFMLMLPMANTRSITKYRFII